MQVSFSDYQIGASVATDLVNTAPEVMAVGDLLATPEQLAAFLVDHDLHLEALPDGQLAGALDVVAVRQLREGLRVAIEAPSAEQVVASVELLLDQRSILPTLGADGHGRWRWSLRTTATAGPADELAVVAAVGLLGTLRSLGYDRFRNCAASFCNGVFVDSSRAGRRRYCMPAICGNRVNVANLRARRRTTR